MPDQVNRDFSGGWKPSVDESNAPPNVLLRSDNLELQDKGILSLRRGYEVVTEGADTPIDTIAEIELDGDATILSKSGAAVYADGEGLGVTVDTGDIAIGAVDGHALISSGTTHHKYDGVTVRNWGIDTPLEAPNVDGVALASKTIANFTQASAEFTAVEGTRSYVTGQDGSANAATGLLPAVGTGRGEMSYAFGSARDLLNFSGGEGGQFDTFEFWFDNGDPTKFLDLEISFGLGSGSDPFDTDGYFYRFGSGLPAIGLTRDEIQQAQDEAVAEGEEVTPAEPPAPRSKDPDAIEQRREERRDNREKL